MDAESKGKEEKREEKKADRMSSSCLSRAEPNQAELNLNAAPIDDSLSLGKLFPNMAEKCVRQESGHNGFESQLGHINLVGARLTFSDLAIYSHCC